MPLENLEEESLAKNPNLDYAQWKYMLTTSEYRNNEEIKNQLFKAIKENNMAPFYIEVCEDLKYPIDNQFLETMKKANEEKLKKLDENIEDAEKNLGEMEVRESNLAKAEYLSSIGDRIGTLAAFDKTFEKTGSIGHKLDIIFHLIRIGLFYMNHQLISKNIEKAKKLIEEGGDWHRRNRLRVYQGVYCLAIRDFKTATQHFLETISTFTCYELTDYKTFVTYTVLASMISLDRVDLREKIVKGAEILEVLHQCPEIREYLFSLYNCQYKQFFIKLAWVEKLLKTDRLLSAHYRYYVREMRILAYNQLLQSYRSLTLDYMAYSFGVTAKFIDQELSKFIAAGRLHCKIDKVNGVVETNRPDTKNYQYQACIKQGDMLLNRIQKLSRVINI